MIPVVPMPEPKAPAGFVRGGTTSAAYDKQVAAQRADTERRRNVMDAQSRVTRDQQKRKDGAAFMHTHLLGGQRSQHPMIVLALKHPNRLDFTDWMTCELTQQGEEENAELALIMACPRCILTLRRPTGESQITILQSNRMFHFEPRPPKWMRVKEGSIWVNPNDPNEVIAVAGTVTMPEWGKCPHLGCGWTFTIDDSVVHTK